MSRATLGLLCTCLACSTPSSSTDSTASAGSTSTATTSDSGSESGTDDPLAGIERDEGSFHNFDQGIRCTYAETLRPTSVEQVQAVVRWAIEQQYPVKVVSSPLSHSENRIICPDESGIQINVAQMNDILAIDSAAGTVKVEPGVQMGDIGDALAEQGRALRMILPLRDFTAAGIIGSGAHNSAFGFPAGIHDMVVELELVDGHGELRTLTGAQARGAAAHLGLLGAIVSVTFATVPQYKTAYGLEKGDDSGLEDTILAKAASHDYVSFSWFPAQSGYSMSYHDVVPLDTPGDAYSTSWHSSAAEQLGFVEVIKQVMDDPDGEQTICNVEAFRYADKKITHEENGVVVDNPVGFSHRMFASTCVDLECPWHAGGQAFNPELAIPVEQLPAWMGRVRAINAAKTTCFPINGILIRFSAASDSWVGSNADHVVAYVEWHIPRHYDATKHEKFADMYDEIFQMTMLEFDARPHWGKNYASTFAALPRTLYPHWDEFDALRAEIDPDGRFSNPFAQIAYGQLPLEPFPGCAIDRSCVCADDSHCAAGAHCEPGLVVSEARVCR